ncbi:MAG: RcpC/CpaB family pilus assembly protein, partial [Actinoplanes sp.]
MRRRILILMAAAILALISGVAVLGYARTADERALNGKEAEWVLLAVKTIPAGTSFADIRTKNLVRQVKMPAETIPDGALSKLDSTMDALSLNAALLPDQLLMRGQFAEAQPTASPTPSFQIPQGRLAVSVLLKVSTQVAGNVAAGNEVTVFATYPGEEDDDNDDPRVTFVLLPRIKVISVGERPADLLPTTASPSPSNRLDVTTTTQTIEKYLVTLSVTPKEATLLINASHTSDLQLALIGPGTKVTAAPKLSLPPSRATPTKSAEQGA